MRYTTLQAPHLPMRCELAHACAASPWPSSRPPVPCVYGSCRSGSFWAAGSACKTFNPENQSALEKSDIPMSRLEWARLQLPARRGHGLTFSFVSSVTLRSVASSASVVSRTGNSISILKRRNPSIGTVVNGSHDTHKAAWGHAGSGTSVQNVLRNAISSSFSYRPRSLRSPEGPPPVNLVAGRPCRAASEHPIRCPSVTMDSSGRLREPRFRKRRAGQVTARQSGEPPCNPAILCAAASLGCGAGLEYRLPPAALTVRISVLPCTGVRRVVDWQSACPSTPPASISSGPSSEVVIYAARWRTNQAMGRMSCRRRADSLRRPTSRTRILAPVRGIGRPVRRIEPERRPATITVRIS